TIYVVRIKILALIHVLILSQRFEAYFYITSLFSAIYSFFINCFGLIYSRVF
ncbi:LOW QUALITY PROTEIN: hypothetical protein HMPREF0105_0944, partial [Bacteroides sp. 3_1_33FAA]